jgi:drug/metabolite transporter (DMT)-like permease
MPRFVNRAIRRYRGVSAMDENSQTPEEPGAATRDAQRGRLLLVAAALLWSTSGLLVKSPPLRTLPLDDRGPLVACYRAFFATACLLPFVRWKRVRFRWGLIPMVASFAAMNAMFVMAMTRTSAAAAIFLQYTATGWAFLFAAVFLKERITRENLVALAFAIAGIGCIVAGSPPGSEFFGILLALGSGMAYGGVVVSLRALRDEDAPWLIALNHLVAGLVLVPWASSLRAYRHLCPNMLLYWTMMEGAIGGGFRVFDFGRSSRGAGTHQFKLQWGAEESPLHWEYVLVNRETAPDQGPANPRFNLAIEAWRRLPLWLANRVGPAIVRNIP